MTSDITRFAEPLCRARDLPQQAKLTPRSEAPHIKVLCDSIAPGRGLREEPDCHLTQMDQKTGPSNRSDCYPTWLQSELGQPKRGGLLLSLIPI